MSNLQAPAIKSQALIGASLFVLGIWLAWQLGGEIAVGDTRSLLFASVAFGGGAIALTILRSWRIGFYIFFVWLVFEDFVRKYMGNGLAFFFGKDILLACVYVAFYIEVRRGREKTFRPPFLLFLSLFFWLAVLQVFNPNSPSILYGLLGLKLYFYYVPLLFIGYALIRTDEDLRKFLVASGVLAGVIAALGIAQAIVGNSFLNPASLAPELQNLGDLSKTTPLTNQILSLPTSVFVSSGRFAEYLMLAFILALGTVAYLLFYTHRNRKLLFLVLGLLSVSTLLSGSRSALVAVVASAIVLSAALLWGAPWRQKQAHRITKAIRRSAIAAAICLGVLLFLFPKEAGSRIAFYTETLNPSSSAYEGSNRAWDYPVQNFLMVFARPNWAVGNGTGTASLGGQYVDKLLGKRSNIPGVEEGYGQMIIEMGILGPFLWILWTGSLLYFGWKVARQLRGTRFFPIAFASVWYGFVLLYPFTYAGLAPYQNYISNVYLWLLTGVLYRLPEVLASAQAPAVIAAQRVADQTHSVP